MPRLLITGVSGFLGWNLFRSLRDRFEVVGTYSAHPPPAEGGRFLRLDLRDPMATEKSILEIAPNIVIHAAALTSPALCMADRFLAWETNVLGTVNIARMARKINARLLYISTDRVFDGKRSWYTEDDPPAPLGYYETTKLAGEEQVRAIVPNALIVRLPL
ncbi:MAG: sugar nucleotide-binding protein, partial [Candidatus Omnitrophica bacterium]|nr:sugar nucleotide-binding protein [Candidatus Omnitrophota bacterium]